MKKSIKIGRKNTRAWSFPACSSFISLCMFRRRTQQHFSVLGELCRIDPCKALTCVLFCAWSYLKYCVGLFVPREIHTDRDINSARLLASFVLHCYTVCRPLFTPFRRATPRKLPPIRNRTHNENKDKRRKKKKPQKKSITTHKNSCRASSHVHTLSLSLVHRDRSHTAPSSTGTGSPRHWKP